MHGGGRKSVSMYLLNPDDKDDRTIRAVRSIKSSQSRFTSKVNGGVGGGVGLNKLMSTKELSNKSLQNDIEVNMLDG